MLIKKQKNSCSLSECPIGLFLWSDKLLCLKTEYWNNGRPECFIVSSGECFVGGTEELEDEFLSLEVIPLDVEMDYFNNIRKAIDAIENLNINEVSKQGGISALNLILNE